MTFRFKLSNSGDQYIKISDGTTEVFVKPGDSASPLFDDAAAVALSLEAPPVDEPAGESTEDAESVGDGDTTETETETTETSAPSSSRRRRR